MNFSHFYVRGGENYFAKGGQEFFLGVQEIIFRGVQEIFSGVQEFRSDASLRSSDDSFDYDAHCRGGNGAPCKQHICLNS